jgi:hypothetical protein
LVGDPVIDLGGNAGHGEIVAGELAVQCVSSARARPADGNVLRINGSSV